MTELEKYLRDNLATAFIGKKEDPKDIIEWIIENKIVNERGVPIEFDDHHFMLDIYRDFSPEQVVTKSAQTGFTIMNTLKTIFASKYMGMNIIYTLPVFDDIKAYVSSKVNQMIERNPPLQDIIEMNTLAQKSFGGNFIFYRGTFHEGGTASEEYSKAHMITSDLNAYDERDRSDESVIELFESRLEASSFRGQWSFSTPTAPKRGVSMLYELSDKKRYFIRCPHCNELQYMEYEKNVLDGEYVCKRCHGRLSDEDRRVGEWVAEFPDNPISGYAVNQMMCCWIPCREVVGKQQKKTKAYFNNFVLGRGYVGSDVTVDRSTILANCTKKLPRDSRNIIGVDVGLKKYYILGNADGIFKIGVVSDWDEIETLMNKYDAKGIFDVAPDLTAPRALKDKYPGRVYLCDYTSDKDDRNTVRWGRGGKWGFIEVDRSRGIQETIDSLVGGDIKLEYDVSYGVVPQELDKFMDHWESMFQTTKTNNLGVERRTWDSDGEDHLVHATLYYKIGKDRFSKAQKQEKKTELSIDPIYREMLLGSTVKTKDWWKY